MLDDYFFAADIDDIAADDARCCRHAMPRMFCLRFIYAAIMPRARCAARSPSCALRCAVILMPLLFHDDAAEFFAALLLAAMAAMPPCD